MKLIVESVEVATLKADGTWWDGPGRPPLKRDELPAFFSLDLDGQLGRLVQVGPAPTPPDLFVKVTAGGALVLETPDQKGFDAEWDEEDASAEIEAGAPLRIEVWDRDVVFDDLCGRIDLNAPSQPAGRWEIPAFGQVRKLVMRLV